LSQRQYNQNRSNLEFLSLIANFLDTTVKEIRSNKSNPEYRLRTTNLKSNLLLINYLKDNPLFSSKYLNYKD
jgi:hypothetical protein